MNRTYDVFSTRYNFPGGENFEVPQYGKQFNWDRNYNFKYDITKNLKFELTKFLINFFFIFLPST